MERSPVFWRCWKVAEEESVTKVILNAPVTVAESYVLLGDKDEAFLWLNKASEARSGLFFLKVDPVFDPIRSDPRYADLLRRMELPQ